jgi:hypothetical protein
MNPEIIEGGSILQHVEVEMGITCYNPQGRKGSQKQVGHIEQSQGYAYHSCALLLA